MSAQSHSGLRYGHVFAMLVAAFIASVLLAEFTESKTVLALIYAIAGIKAYLVLNYFIHLNAEPRFIRVLVLGVMLVLVVLYVGLIPDIVWVYGGVKGAS